jgi:lipooligosaccharide transport system permease protein
MSARAVSGPYACLLVVEGNWAWLRRNWRATLVSNLLQPVLFLIAIGIGFGALVTPADVPSGTSYLVYLAPALLAVSCTQQAASEATFPLLSGFVWQQSFRRITAAPVSPEHLATGQLLWIALRLTATGVLFLGVAALLGATGGPRILLALPAAVLSGMAFAAPLAAFAAGVRGAGNEFDMLFRFVVTPMTLFAGTFFPIELLPEWVRPIAWIAPLWHGTELSRAAASGEAPGLATAGHVGYLLLWLVLGGWAATRRFRTRLRP